jgi:hypothetical protein
MLSFRKVVYLLAVLAFVLIVILGPKQALQDINDRRDRLSEYSFFISLSQRVRGQDKGTILH